MTCNRWIDSRFSRQVLRFGLVGVGATLVHLAVFAAVAEGLKISPQLANVAGFLVAFAVSFAGHAGWTFRDQIDERRLQGGHLVRFFCVSLAGFVFNSAIVYLVTAVFHHPARAALVLMATLTPAILFILNRYWVFRLPGARSGPLHDLPECST